MFIKIISDEDEIDDIYDPYDSQGDVKFSNIKTTGRKVGDTPMWDLFEVSLKFQNMSFS